MWLEETSPRERRTLLAAFLGYGVDGFDFMIYSFVIPTLLTAWHMTLREAGYIATGSLAETIDARHRGKAAGLVQSSWAVGWALAALAYWSVYALVPAALAA